MSLALDDAGRGSDPLLSRLRELTDVVAQQNATIAALRIERDTVRSEHQAARAEIEKLRLLIRQLQRNRFGRRSERLDPDQLQLGLEDLEQTVAAAEAAQEEAATRSGTPRAPRVRRRNRGALPAHLPRVEVLVDVGDKGCPCCGGALHVIGEDTSEMLDIVPAQLRGRGIRRPRYGCPARAGGVGPGPPPALRLPGLRGGGGAGPRAGAAGRRRDGERGAARARAGGQVRRLPALVPPGGDLRPARHRPGPLDPVRLGGPGVLVAGAAVAPLAPARHGLDQDLRRPHYAAGAR